MINKITDHDVTSIYPFYCTWENNSVTNSYPSDFYVYAYIRHNISKTSKTGTLYYFGKGQNNRMSQPHSNLIASSTTLSTLVATLCCS